MIYIIVLHLKPAPKDVPNAPSATNLPRSGPLYRQ
jgi:hypothetical protein